MNFDEIFRKLVGIEGGYVNDPDDPGGETKFGISKRSYPNVDIKALTLQQAEDIYMNDFWKRGKMAEFDSHVAFIVFDAAVNHGVETAIRMLQRALDVADDGIVGPVTIKAASLKLPSVIIAHFVAERLEFWAKLSTFGKFGRGWTRRGATSLRMA